MTRHLKASLLGGALMVFATFTSWVAVRTGIDRSARALLPNTPVWGYFIGSMWEPTGYVYWGLQRFGVSTPDVIRLPHAYAINGAVGLLVGWASSRIYTFMRQDR